METTNEQNETSDNLKQKIQKWQAKNKRVELIHIIKQLHVKDPSMRKKDLQTYIDIVINNESKLHTEEGMDLIVSETGIKKEKLVNKYKPTDTFHLEPKEPTEYELAKLKEKKKANREKVKKHREGRKGYDER